MFVDSFAGAMKEARKTTNEGILVILEKFNNDLKNVLNQMKENWKRYTFTVHEYIFKDKNDFETENPYKFLLEGSILVISEHTSFGFDWPTVVVFSNPGGYVSHHR